MNHLDELENKMALFRDDNWTKQSAYNQDEEYDGGLET